MFLSGAASGAALVVLLVAIGFGTVRYGVRSDCGSVFNATAGADHDCGAILRLREAIFWVVLVTGVGLGLAGAVGVRSSIRSTSSKERVASPPGG